MDVYISLLCLSDNAADSSNHDMVRTQYDYNMTTTQSSYIWDERIL